MTNAQRVSSERKESTEMVSEAGGEGEMEEGGGAPAAGGSSKWK